MKNHISPKMGRKLIAIHQTMWHSWFMVYQRLLPQLHLHLHHHHLLQHRLPYWTKADTPKIQYQKEVEVRAESFGETRCMSPQKPKNKNQNEEREVQSDIPHELPDWLQDCKENLIDESSPIKPWRNPEDLISFPPGSVPAELLKAVLFPSWLHRDRSKPGVGAPTMQATLSKLFSFPVRKCVMKIFRMIRSTQRSPVMWHSAQAAYVSKHNGKAWTEGERVVMVMCPFGRAFHRSVLQRGLAAMPLAYSPWTFGSITGRRREEAILLQLVTSWRLRRAGISHVTRMHDGVNAFLSVRQS